MTLHAKACAAFVWLSLVQLSPAQERKADRLGDPLPAGAVLRLGNARLRHPGVAFLSFSPEGTLLASSDGAQVSVWEAATGKEIARLATRYGPVAFTPDGQNLSYLNQHNQLVPWCIAGRKEARRFSIPPGSLLLTLSHPSAFAAVLEMTIPRRIHVWDLNAHRPIGKIVLPVKKDASQVAYLLSADGKQLLKAETSPQGESVIRIWDTVSGTERPAVKTGTGALHDQALSPDGKYVAWTTQAGDGFVYDLASHREVNRIAASVPGTASVAFARDSQVLAVGQSQQVTLVQVGTGAVLRRLSGPFAQAPRLAFSPDGKRLAVAGAGGVIGLWEVTTGRRTVAPSGPEASVQALLLTADGRTVVGSCADQTIRVWDLESGEQLRRFAWPAADGAEKGKSLVLLALALKRGELLVAWSNGELRRWDLSTGKELAGRHRLAVGSLIASFDQAANVLATAGPDGVVRLWDAATGRQLRRLGPTPRPGQQPAVLPPVSALAFAPDGRTLAQATYGRFPSQIGYIEMPGPMPIQLWETASGKQRGQLALPTAITPFIGSTVVVPGDAFPPWSSPQSDITALCFSPDGRQLAFVAGATLHLWNVDREQEVRRCALPALFLPTVPMAFSPDGKVLALAVEGGCVLRDVERWDEVGRANGHRGQVVSLVFAANGKRLITGGVDSTGLVWDVPTLLETERQRKKLSPQRLASLWADLAAEDARQAHQAVSALAAAPPAAVLFLAGHLRPVPPIDEKRLVELVAELGHERYTHRQRAERELGKVGELAVPALEKALGQRPALELQRRIEQMLDKLTRPPTGDALRPLRAVEVLERAGTPGARQVLEKLAGGAEQAELTRQARAALKRLGQPARPAPAATTPMSEGRGPQPSGGPTASASSSLPGCAPEGALDGDGFGGDLAHAWHGRPGPGPWWWQVRFAGPQRVGALLQVQGDGPTWLRNAPRRYIWQTSTDGQTWTDVPETAVADERRTFRLHRLSEAITAQYLRLRVDSVTGDHPVLRAVKWFADPDARVAFPEWAVVVNTTGQAKVPGAGGDFIPLARSCPGWKELPFQQVWLGDFDRAFVAAEPRPFCAFLSGNLIDWCQQKREHWSGTQQVLGDGQLPLWASCGGAQGLAILAAVGTDRPWDCPQCRDPKGPKLPIYTHIAGSRKRACGDYSACVFERGPTNIVQVVEDPIFAGLPREFRAVESHCGQIEWPPKGWVLIAAGGPGSRTRTQCLRVQGRCIYAAQFHIEMPGTPATSRMIMANFLRLARERAADKKDSHAR